MPASHIRVGGIVNIRYLEGKYEKKEPIGDRELKGPNNSSTYAVKFLLSVT